VVPRHQTRYPGAPGVAAHETLVSALTAPSILTPCGGVGAEAREAMVTVFSRVTWAR
jgi:hypothetical protein